jgi:hypothetical protein
MPYLSSVLTTTVGQRGPQQSESRALIIRYDSLEPFSFKPKIEWQRVRGRRLPAGVVAVGIHEVITKKSTRS